MGLSDLESSQDGSTRIIAIAKRTSEPSELARDPWLVGSSLVGSFLRQGVKAVNWECACNYAT